MHEELWEVAIIEALKQDDGDEYDDTVPHFNQVKFLAGLNKSPDPDGDLKIEITIDWEYFTEELDGEIGAFKLMTDALYLATQEGFNNDPASMIIEIDTNHCTGPVVITGTLTDYLS